MPNDPIQINPVDLEPDVALGVNLPMDAANGAGLNPTYYTKDQIKANITSLFTTMIGERVMQPLFGTYLFNLLFEQSNSQLKEKQLTSECKRALKVWIPQVSLTNISFPEVVDNKKVIIRLEYIIPNYNIQDEVTLEVQ